MPVPGEQQVQRRKKCWACARNQHKKCDIHLNDGAVDAEEFINVNCGCVCEGKIGTQYDSLIAMVMAYKEMVDSAEQKARTQSMLAARSASTADEALELIRAFLQRGYDDEGNIIQERKGEIFDQAVGSLTAGLERIAAEQEAVFNQLVNGDEHSRISDMLDHLFGPDEDEQEHIPWWKRHTDVPDSELAVPMATPAPTPTDEQLMYDRWFKGARFGRPPVVTGKIDDDWASEGGDPNREDEGWPYE